MTRAYPRTSPAFGHLMTARFLRAAATLWLTFLPVPATLQAQQLSHQRPLYPGPVDSAGLARLVDGNLAAAQKAYDGMLAGRGRRSAANTIRQWDEALNRASDAQGIAEIAVNIHPDSAVRREGIRAVERVSRFRNGLNTDPRAARAFQALDTTTLTAVERLLVSRAIRDFRRAGVLLPDADRARVRSYLETLDRLSTAFGRNIAEDTTTFAVAEKEAVGMPADWVSRHQRDPAGRLIVTLQYPDFFPVITYSANRALRERMWLGFENRARTPNKVVMDSLLRVREAAAHLLGYPTWAAYQAEPQMAASADSIAMFIERCARPSRRPMPGSLPGSSSSFARRIHPPPGSRSGTASMRPSCSGDPTTISTAGKCESTSPSTP